MTLKAMVPTERMSEGESLSPDSVNTMAWLCHRGQPYLNMERFQKHNEVYHILRRAYFELFVKRGFSRLYRSNPVAFLAAKKLFASAFGGHTRYCITFYRREAAT